MEFELAIARRLLKQADVLANLPETPLGSRALMGQAFALLEEVCDITRPLRIKAVARMVHRLDRTHRREKQAGAAATLRRLESTIAALADARTTGPRDSKDCAQPSPAVP